MLSVRFVWISSRCRVCKMELTFHILRAISTRIGSFIFLDFQVNNFDTEIKHEQLKSGFVGIDLKIRTVCIKHRSLHRARFDGLHDNHVEDILMDCGAVKTAAAVLR